MSSSTIGSSAAAESEEERIPLGRIVRVGAIAIAAAAVANVVVWALAKAILDIDDDFQPLETVALPIVSTVVWLGLGVGALVLLVRFARRPIERFRQVAVVGLLISFFFLLSLRGQEGTNAAGIATLIVMHLVAFAIAVPLLTTRTRGA